jgi:hypothetical protein
LEGGGKGKYKKARNILKQIIEKASLYRGILRKW